MTIAPFVYLALSMLGIGFFVYLRLSGKKEGIKEVKLETAEKTIESVDKSQNAENAVTRFGDGTVRDELLRDWTKK